MSIKARITKTKSTARRSNNTVPDTSVHRLPRTQAISRPLLFLLCCGLAMALLAPLAQAKDGVYTFGVVPQQSAKKLAKLWAPVLRHLSKETGVKFQFKTAKNIPEFEKRLAAGGYDFAYMNPYHFTVYNESPGYKAVAVRKEQPIKGILVVKKDSKINDSKQLDNKDLAFPSPAAFAASILPRAMLKNQGFTITPHYVSSHDSVYLNVAKGLYPAGGGVMRTFNNAPPHIKEQLSVLWKSEGYTPHAIASHPKIPESVRLNAQTALVNMVKAEKTQKYLKALKIKKGLIAANDKNWDDVRKLNIGLLEQ